MLFLLLLYYITLLTTRSLGAELYEFNLEHGDQMLSFSNDSYAVTLDVPIIYFEENQNELFIHSKGIVTFGKTFDVTHVSDLDQAKINAIAIFFAPVSAGKIFYRATSSDTNLLHDLTDKIRRNFPNRESSDFKALHAVVITWSDMMGEDPRQGSNQFQMILVTDGMSSYVFLIYNRITWTGRNDQHAQAGLYSSDGRRESMINSGTVSIKELVNLSNNQNEGTYIFRISGAAPEDPRGALVEDDYNYSDYEQEYDSNNEHKRQHKPLTEDCPTDPYHDQCPAECQVLTDDRGCSLCVCARLFFPFFLKVSEPPQSNKVEENVDEVDKNVVVPNEHEQSSVRPEESASKGALEEQDIKDKQPKTDDENERESKLVVPMDPENSGSIHDIEGIALSCAVASEKLQPCSSHAKCIDYDPGYCCECLSGYYGNGEECLKDGEPQRINGGFEGVINGKEMDRTELHTYVMVEEGRSYTALSQISPELGRSLLLLNAIGGAMGWLFAKVISPTSYNGFMLTGGLFNRTVNVHIGDRYMVTIKQQFSGRDIYHYFKAHMFISGTLPKLMEDAEVIYSDHEEEYRREGPGFLRSYSSQMITVKENGAETQMKLSTDQQIHYKECPFREFTKDPVIVIHVSRIHVVYDVEEHIVRYASANMATNRDTNVMIGLSNIHGQQLLDIDQQSQQQQKHYRNQQSHRQKEDVESQRLTCTNCLQNACESGRHLCTLQNMICMPVERSYRCECIKGYQAEYDNNTELGWKCIDMNECERGEHKCGHNAICINLEEIGVDDQIDEKAPVIGSGCLDHRDCHQWGECVFGKNGEPGYCKCRGWYTGDGVHHCGPPAETEIKQVVIEDSQPEQVEQTCGGYKCDANAYCNSSSGREQCTCQNGYTGNGISCAADVSDQRKPNVPDGKVCRSHEECGIHGNCVYNNELGAYRCVCVPPYFSDGVNCVESKGDSNSSKEFLERVPCNVVNNCNTNADCIFEKNDRGESVYRCRCRPGFSGDGHRCTMTSLDNLPAYAMLGCDKLGNCDLNAVCVLDAYTSRHYCRCLDGFDGDGYMCEVVRQNTLLPPLLPEPIDAKTCREASDCHQNAHCVVRENSLDYFCECLPGYRGDGVTRCIIADDCTPGNKQMCHENADCVFGEIERTYTCKCLEGFIGNGRQCVTQNATTCNEQPEICHHSAHCIYSRGEERYECVCKDGTVGDGYADCREEVGLHRCGVCSSHAQCVHVEADDSWRCRCMQGYVGNGNLCTLYTSCLDDRSLCDEHAECVPNEYGHYVCNCHYGYHGNGQTCIPDSESRDEAIFICRGMTIIQKSTSPGLPGKQLIVVPHQIAVGIDFDCLEERIVWSDNAGHSILSASINGTDEQKFMNSVLKSPEGVAVDWSSRNVYYADSVKDEIGVLSLDGKYYKTLINEGLVNPRALAIDLIDRYLYYSDWHRENPVIGRVRLDGTEKSAFITTEVHLPNGLAVLLERRQLCWVDAGLQQLSCIGLNGNNRRIVYAPLQYPFGLTVHNEQRFYWTDWSDNKIHSVSVNGDGYMSFPATIGGSGRLYGLVSVPLRCKGVATACAVNNGGCEYLCLPGKTDVTCACPDNIDRCD
ncbi:G2F domain protein [Onchocerca flexuosa]|uniref:G2F domain protein n=1 Tax=Onchocerca flexuosa TaxID=387005 RepID=A0A238BWT8_9BILA|nr:G2F domain protein [Onchocerca flexuosa]